MPKIPKISQSLIKAFYDYLHDKICGKRFEALYITKTAKSVPTVSMLAGQYFEYLCTGSLPKSGITPQPETTQKGELTAQFKKAKESVELFNNIIKHYDIQITSVGATIETLDSVGTLDIEAKWDGRYSIIDEKYSGLLEDKWQEQGWNTESLNMKDSITIQGLHYTYLAMEFYKLPLSEVDFYFFVFDSTNPLNAKIIKLIIDESKMESHKQTIQNVKENIAYHISRGFDYKPNLSECLDCPLFATCPKATKVPIIEPVYYP